eukprot:695320_1
MAQEAAKTMKALLCTVFGPPKDSLSFVNKPIPTIPNDKPFSVLVKILYASLNPVDYKIVTGSFGPVSPRKPPFIPGKDYSGIVVAKGSQSPFEIGDFVYGNDWATFAEYTVVSGRNIHKIPKTLSPLQAASVPLVAQTSYQVLVDKMHLQKTDKVLILGGSTAVGIWGIQIAKHVIGCSEVIVTSSQVELCTSLGADRVINYREEKWTEVLKDYGVDAIYDCVGGLESWQLCQSQGVIKKDGRYITLVGDTTHGGQFSVKSIMGIGLSMVNRKFWNAVGSGPSYAAFLTDSTKSLPELTAAIESGKLKPVLDKESPFAFDDWLSMFNKSMAHKARGKLVIKIGDEEIERKVDNDEEKEENKPVSKEVVEEAIVDTIVDDNQDKDKEVKASEKEEDSPKGDNDDDAKAD